MDTNNLESWMTIGAYVKVAEWVGQIVDIAHTENGRIMLLITSPKGIYRNHRDEWLEVQPGMIQPATREDYLRDVQLYIQRTSTNLEKLNQLAAQS
jgi:hypothetical protein